MKNAIILIADGFELCEALIVADLLKRAKVNTTLISINNSLEVNSSSNIKIKCDKTLIEVTDFDVVILPGGPGTDNLIDSNSVSDLVLQAYNDNKIVAAICAAPTVLSRLGILEGKQATVFPGMEEEVRLFSEKVEVLNQGVVKVDNVITARALGSGFDFALCIIEALLGTDESKKVRQSIYYKE